MCKICTNAWEHSPSQRSVGGSHKLNSEWRQQLKRLTGDANNPQISTEKRWISNYEKGEALLEIKFSSYDSLMDGKHTSG